MQIVVPWTVGLSLLPNAGGVYDQDFIEMRLFQAFLEGERAGQAWLMKK